MSSRGKKSRRNKSKNKPAPRAAEPEPRSLWGVARGMVGPAFIVGGLGVISKDLFGPGTVIVYLGCAMLWLETIFEPWMLKRSLQTQCLFILLALMVPAWFTLAIVAVEGPINFYSYALRTRNYDDGTIIGSITWNSHFTDLTVSVANLSTEADYTDFKVAVVPDQWIYKATIVGEDYGCRLEAISAGNALMTAARDGNQPTKMAIHQSGDSFYPEDNAGDIYKNLATAGGYRLRCSELPRRSAIKVVFAAITIRPEILNNLPRSPRPKPEQSRFDVFALTGLKSDVDQFGDRPNPLTVRLDGDYKSGMRKFTVLTTLNVSDGN